MYSDDMRVRVLFFGRLRDLSGQRTEEIQLADGATVGDLLGYYGRSFPEMQRHLASLATAVNEEYAPQETVLHEGDEVALLPPVSGGSEAVREPAKGRRAFLVAVPIDAECVLASIKDPADGAVVVFDGVVRNNSRGRRTLYLDYEAYESMALEQLESLVVQARQKFAIRDATVVHRLGRIEIGESSVVIAVASAHRGAAFDACRWIIDTLKTTVPIWKKEHFEDGAVWADGEPFPPEISGSRSAKEDGSALNRADRE